MLAGLIPARGGSKSIPMKNLAMCGENSLLGWAAHAALEARALDRVLLSTDDEEIAQAGRDLGLDVPFMRPPDFADDTAPMLGVMQHALGFLRAQGSEVEAICLLQPTSPFRTAEHVEAAVSRYRETGAATLVSVVAVPHNMVPESQMRLTEDGLVPYLGGDIGRTRRQDKESLFARNGPAILIVRADVLDQDQLYGAPTIGFEMDAMSSIDIDTQEDLDLANMIMRERSR